MKIVVLKFGGTSVGTIKKIKRVAKIIIDYKKKNYKVIVVSSAMSGVTNELIKKSYEIRSISLYKNRNNDLSNYIFNSKSFSQMIYRLKYFNIISEINQKSVNKIKTTQKFNRQKTSEISGLLDKVEESKNYKKTEISSLNQKKRYQEKLLKQLKKEENEVKAEIAIQLQQIDALETMQIDSKGFLSGPRIYAGLICFPILTAFFDIIGIFGGYFSGSFLMGLDADIYWKKVFQSVQVSDVYGGLFKALVFGFLTMGICTFEGYYAHVNSNFKGVRGVTLAATKAVVKSSICVLVFDYLITSFLL